MAEDKSNPRQPHDEAHDTEMTRILGGSNHTEGDTGLSADLTFGLHNDDQMSSDESQLVRKLESSGAGGESRHVGRYKVERKLGSGGFGLVVLAVDIDLQRRVAIKIPHRQRFRTEEDVARFFDEARTVAALDHPGVVPIYDFGRFDNRCFVVYKYIEGGTLQHKLANGTLTIQETVKLLESIAGTLQFIHDAGIIHRDLKPANLLLDKDGGCYISDFGLAMHDDSLLRRPGRIGTYAYMSPEQARGESHLVDGRSDLFSVGVMMYEICCGKRPFAGETSRQTLALIRLAEPPPPHQCNPGLPKELERICLKLLAKRATSRYQSANDLREDLAFFLEHNFLESGQNGPTSMQRNQVSSQSDGSSSQLIGIVPRGLRAFNEEDAAYFGALLPGPRDRRGLPEILSFWKRKIESTDPLETFRVGVIYGSSGSGKSSFVRAGLIPLLDQAVSTVIVDASGHHTERGLLSVLRARIPKLPETLTLVESLAWIRNHPDQTTSRKTLIVIDQFEQWLHFSGNSSNQPLALALRQCDGTNLQCVLLVRDDFWAGVSRLADELEIDLVRNQNLSMIDLFDKQHARHVLTEYGRGYGRLPARLSEFDENHRAFLDQAIDGLATDGKIVPIQLVTFAEILKNRPWIPKSMLGIGGIEGVGVRFLEETIGAAAPAEYRRYAAPAQLVLKSLLPEAGTDIKGATQNENQLRSICGYESDPSSFDRLISILDKDLRLITPAEPEPTVASNNPSPRYYQLTHDFLVPAIRNWLQRNQRLSFAGRIALRLSDRADVWTTRQAAAHLPSWPEWLLFLLMTDSSAWDSGERRLMRAATSRNLKLTAIAILAFAGILWGGWYYRGSMRTASLIQQLATATTSDTPSVLDQLDGYHTWSESPIGQLIERTTILDDAGLHARLAWLRLHPDDNDVFDQLAEQLTKGKIDQVPLIRDELRRHSRYPEIANSLQSRLRAAADNALTRTKLAFALAGPIDHPQFDKLADSIVDAIIESTSKDPQIYALVIDQLGNQSAALFDSLHHAFRNTNDVQRQQQALNLILSFYQSDPTRLLDAFLDADRTQALAFLSYFPREHAAKLSTKLLIAIHNQDKSNQIPRRRVEAANRIINAASLLMRFGRPQECWPLLEYQEDPTIRSGIIERVTDFETDPNLLLGALTTDMDPAIESAILLMLGNASEQFDSDQLDVVGRIGKERFLTSPHADVHSASSWLLKQLNHRLLTNRWIDQQLANFADSGVNDDFQWSVNSGGQTMIRMKTEAGVLEVADHEVTIQQYRRWKPMYQLPSEEYTDDRSPAVLVNWYEAVAYCRWLTEREGLGEEHQCHPPEAIDGDNRLLYDDYQQRKGYRLLTAEEWELGCFSGVTTDFGFGNDPDLLQEYGWTLFEKLPLQPVATRKPLPSGLFGMYGNASEWCTSRYRERDQRLYRGARAAALLEYVLKLSRRGEIAATTRYYSIGFRICRMLRE